jgi:hypothetical protein
MCSCSLSNHRSIIIRTFWTRFDRLTLLFISIDDLEIEWILFDDQFLHRINVVHRYQLTSTYLVDIYLSMCNHCLHETSHSMNDDSFEYQSNHHHHHHHHRDNYAMNILGEHRIWIVINMSIHPVVLTWIDCKCVTGHVPVNISTINIWSDIDCLWSYCLLDFVCLSKNNYD